MSAFATEFLKRKAEARSAPRKAQAAASEGPCKLGGGQHGGAAAGKAKDDAKKKKKGSKGKKVQKEKVAESCGSLRNEKNSLY